jgi:hypothetical protein
VNINHSPEYIALWKSHKRAEWEAGELGQQCEQLRQQLEEAENRAQTLIATGPVAVATGAPGSIAQESRMLVEQLERELRRKWELHSEIGADLERVSEALTPAQRKQAAKVLEQWEQQQGGALS